VGQFKFELSWLTKEDIMEVVRPIWEEDANGKCAIDEWNWRLGNTRKKLRGWAKNVDAAYKKEKKDYLIFFKTLMHKLRLVGYLW
jgi:hypothetical protein